MDLAAAAGAWARDGDVSTAGADCVAGASTGRGFAGAGRVGGWPFVAAGDAGAGGGVVGAVTDAEEAATTGVAGAGAM